MSHRCVQSLYVITDESRDWGYVIHKIKDGLIFVNMVQSTSTVERSTFLTKITNEGSAFQFLSWV